MGCCSSNRSTQTHSPGTTTDLNKLESQSTTASAAQHRLAQHQDIITHEEFEEDEEEEEDDDIPISGAFARNKSIQNEIMRLHGFGNEESNEQHSEIKSNENSEDFETISNEAERNHSFAEFHADTVQIIDASDNNNNTHHKHLRESPSNDEQDPSHPFGLIQSDKVQNNDNAINNLSDTENDKDNDSDTLSQSEMIGDLEALYEENLKQHGFDADKFRSANLKATQQSSMNEPVGKEKGQRSVSVDLSSFASSQLSSSQQSKMSAEEKEKPQPYLGHDSIDEYQTDKLSENDDDDLMMQELRMSQKRPTSISRRNTFERSMVDTSDEEDSNVDAQEAIDENEANYVDYDEEIGYIENFKDSVIENKREIGNIMDDEDEELMNAILSLGS
eukprot:CAMPEP_0197023818 /NCGR_PEP_ID=MMETSP1384-20130603/4456_1 /TAXON_ID=29189 /ORGANISM="Ammonia sp." /LENGTH=389 /DNA_ID=CAMNT_0042452095 /DNA_START=43 /DNA_END=1212 /DNA_ORIENTATION=-